MVEKNITTWEDFKNALTESITEETTYNIKNDLDATNDILTKNITCKSPYNKIFMGNDYKINGITAYGNVTALYTAQANNFKSRFYNIKFTNFMVESGTFTNLCRDNNEKNLFVNCFFNGVCKNFIGSVSSTKTVYFTKCSFNVRCENFGDSCSFDSCYIIIEPLQNTNNFGSNSTLINSYVEGIIKNSFSSSNYLTPQFKENNVFNCKVIITNYSDSTTYKTRSSTAPTLINRDKLLQSDGVTPIKNITSPTNIYFLTDKQLKNKEYIQENTTFPLYG